MNQLRSWSNSSAKRVLRPPVKCKESFLELVRSLKFDERFIDGGKSIISSARSATQSEEEIDQSTDTNATAAVQTEQQVEQPTGGETSDTTATQSQQEAKPSTGDQTTTATSATTATRTQQKTQQSTASESNATASVDKVPQPEQEIQRFRTTHSAHIQLTDNDRKCEKIGKNGDYQSVVGTLTYTSGIHRIRLKVEKGFSDIFFGICSETKLPNGAYLYDKPSVHGWFVHGYLVKNGHSPQPGWSIVDVDDILELTINCDEQKLSIHNETTGAKNSMEVNTDEAPFPWCLFVLIHFTGSRLSLL